MSIVVLNPADVRHESVLLVLMYIRVVMDVTGVVFLGSACLGRQIPYARFFRVLPAFSLAFLLALHVPLEHTYRIALAFVTLSLLLSRWRLLSAFYASGAALLGMSFLALFDVSFGQLAGSFLADRGVPAPTVLRMVYSMPVAALLAGSGIMAQALLRRFRVRRGERRKTPGKPPAEVGHRDYLTMTQLFVGLLIVSNLAHTPAVRSSPVTMMLSPLLVFSIILGGHYVRSMTRCDTRRLVIQLLETLILGLLVVYIVLYFRRENSAYRLLLVPLVVSASLKPAPVIGVITVVGSVVFLAALSFPGATATGSIVSATDGIYIATTVIVWWLVRGFVRTEYALRTRLEHQATTDALTGLYNRRYLFDFLDSLSPAERNRTSLIVLDIDDFKVINDTHGHEFGDDILTTVADALRSAVRSEELVARYGGDEFVVVVRDAEPQSALEIAHRIGTVLGGLVVDQVTPRFSLGIASGDGGHGAESLFARADQELYRAKREGKCRISVEGHLHSLSTEGGNERERR